MKNRTLAPLFGAAAAVIVGCSEQHPIEPTLVQSTAYSGDAVPFPSLFDANAIDPARIEAAFNVTGGAGVSTNIHDRLEVVVDRTVDETVATLTFEGGQEIEYLAGTVEPLGATFNDWYTLIDKEAGGSGEFANEPSPSTVGFWFLNETCQRGPKDDLGLVIAPCARLREVELVRPATRVSIYYTSFLDVTVTAFAGNTEVATVTGPANYGMGGNSSGDQGAYNLFTPLEVTAPGNVITRVQITGYVNGTGIDDLQITRDNEPPVVVAEVPGSPEEGDEALLGGSGTTDDQDLASELTYAWDFGDPNTAGGGSANTADATHTYEEDGTYTASLTVTDLNGASAIEEVTLTVANVAPTATFTAPPLVTAGNTFTISLTDPFDPSPGDTQAGFKYAFDCGAGYGPLDTTAQATCTAPASGPLVVASAIRDRDGGETNYARSVALNAPPVVIAEVPGSPEEGDETLLIGSGTTDDQDLASELTYEWEFGDPNTVGGGSAATADASHTYEESGTYTASLTVTDLDGATTTEEVTFTVANVAPTATFSTPPLVTAGNTFTISLTDPFDPSPGDTQAGFEYAFDCGSGYGSFGTTAQATCTAPASGPPVVAGVIRDRDGGETHYTSSVDLNAPPAVVAEVSGSPKEGSATLLSGSGTTDDLDLASELTYDWDFGDPNTAGGGSATAADATHTYEESGTYTASLTVTDLDGASATETVTFTVANVAPTATFTAPPLVTAGNTFSISLTDPFDPSPGDTQAGFEYKFLCGSVEGTFGPTAQTTCTAPANGPLTVAGVVRDRDEGATHYTSSIVVEVPDVVEPDPIEVSIDVKPEAINLGSRAGGGVITVFIRRGSGYDLSDIDPSSLILGDGSGPGTPIATHGSGAFRFQLARPHAIAQFELSDLIASGDISSGTTSLILRGNLNSGSPIEGLDHVRVLPERGRGGRGSVDEDGGENGDGDEDQEDEDEEDEDEEDDDDRGRGRGRGEERGRGRPR